MLVSHEKFFYGALGLTVGLIVLGISEQLHDAGLHPNNASKQVIDTASPIIGDLVWAGGKVTTRCIQQQDEQGLYLDKGLLMAVDVEDDSSLSVLFINGKQVECSYAL